MKRSLFSICLFIYSSTNLIGQTNITVKDVRKINIEVFKKINNFENYLFNEYIDFIDEGLMISNDLYVDNSANKIIKIKDYFQDGRVSYKKKPKGKFEVLNIDLPVDITDSTLKFNVKVQKIISSGELLCDSIIFSTIADTLNQLIKFEAISITYNREISSNEESDANIRRKWVLTMKEIKTLDSEGVRIEAYRDTNQLSTMFRESYATRYGLELKFIDAVYSESKEVFINNKNKYLPKSYFIDDISDSIKINKNINYSNYNEMLKDTNNKNIKRNNCINILKIPIKDYGKTGYFEAFYGLTFLSNSNRGFSYENILTSEVNSNIDFSYSKPNYVYGVNYHFYLPKKIIFNVGFSIINNNYSFTNNINGFTENYNSVDIDGGSYNRKVSYESFNEIYDLSYISIGPSFGFEYELVPYKSPKFNHSLLNLFIDYSILNMNCQSAVSNRSSELNYSGTYSDLFNITFSENGVYDFGSYELENRNVQETKVNNLSHNISLGIKCYPFKKNRMYFAASMSYITFSKSLFNSNNDLRLSQNSAELNSFFSNSKSFNLNTYTFSFQIGGWINR